MKKQIIAIIIVIALMLAFCACGQENDTDTTQSYLAEQVQLPNEMERSPSLKVQDSVIYVYDEISSGGEKELICAVSLDGTILHSYAVDTENCYISGFCPDENGLWVTTALFDEDNAAEYQGTNLQHFRNEEGVVASSAEAIFPVEGTSSADISLLVDRERDCIYLVIGEDGACEEVICMDSTGNTLFTLASDGDFFCPSFTADGQFVVLQNQNDVCRIVYLDHEARAWVKGEELEISCTMLFDCGAYGLYGSDGQRLIGIDPETGTCAVILNWLDAGIDQNVFAVYDLGDDTLLVSADNGVFLVTPLESVDSGIVLTLATFNYEDASAAALEFNSSQSEYRVVVKDYSEFNTRRNSAGGLEQLGLDIASGDAPDLYDLRGLPVSQYIQKGLLEDMYPYIDTDPSMSREDFFPSLLKAMEADGGLYCIIPHCAIITMAAAPETAENPEDWSVQAMAELAAGADPFAGSVTRYDFLQYMLAGYDSTFVDWRNGSCSFDEPEFAALLEFVKLLPEESPTNWDDYDPLLLLSSVSSGLDVRINRFLLDCADDDAYVQSLGLPGEESPRFLIAPAIYSWGMSASGEHKDGAWAFISTFLSEEYQEDRITIPLRITAWDALREMEETNVANGFSSFAMTPKGDLNLTINDTRHMDALEELIPLVNGFYEENTALMEIIWSEAQTYFAGDKTVEEAVNLIQSRVSIYLAEQG